MNISRPSTTARPAAPSRVVTVGIPARIASSSFIRTPEPPIIGATMAIDFVYKSSRSCTYPTVVIPGRAQRGGPSVAPFGPAFKPGPAMDSLASGTR